MSQFLELAAMEAKTQLQLQHQIQITITTRRLNLPHPTKPSTFSWPTRSSQNGITLTALSARLRLPETIAPAGSSSKRAQEQGVVTEEGAADEEVVEKEDWEMGAEEWKKLGFDDELCGERKGIAEVMECLEEEAILGSDEGREATDYNRRARIFDKSSRVFQALKQRNAIG